MDNPLCLTFRRRLTRPSLRSVTLSPPLAQRGDLKKNENENKEFPTLFTAKRKRGSSSEAQTR
jgi:hypothetical protein